MKKNLVLTLIMTFCFPDYMPIMSQAFPAGSGPTDRTTYMFTYVSPQPGCPTLEDLFEDYWDLMPAYQVGMVFLGRDKKCISFLTVCIVVMQSIIMYNDIFNKIMLFVRLMH